MKTLLLIASALVVFTGCGQTAKQNETTEAQKPQSAPQVKTQTEKKPVFAEKVLLLDKPTDEQINNHKVTASTLSKLRAEINNIEAANECDSSMQCEVVAAGSRACGGPSHYMIYSTKHTSKEKALSIASELTKYESLYNAQNDMQSICAMLTKPSTQCIDNKCVKLTNSSQLAY
tara:strand:- start:747 stop:1271 length:525 start_codon:yes stop_codon:yes gene_type:complete